MYRAKENTRVLVFIKKPKKLKSIELFDDIGEYLFDGKK